MSLTREQIANAIKKATGDPTSGPIAVITPAIIDAIDAVANPNSATAKKQDNKQEQAKINKAEETRNIEDK